MTSPKGDIAVIRVNPTSAPQDVSSSRLLHDLRRYGATLEGRTGKRLREAVVADRWMEERYEPTIDSIPKILVDKLEPAELYHQILEHRWFLSERRGFDVGLEEAVHDYALWVLTPARDEHVTLLNETPTQELFLDL